MIYVVKGGKAKRLCKTGQIVHILAEDFSNGSWDKALCKASPSKGYGWLKTDVLNPLCPKCKKIVSSQS